MHEMAVKITEARKERNFRLLREAGGASINDVIAHSFITGFQVLQRVQGMRPVCVISYTLIAFMTHVHFSKCANMCNVTEMFFDRVWKNRNIIEIYHTCFLFETE